jgi:hypothetical protein
MRSGCLVVVLGWAVAGGSDCTPPAGTLTAAQVEDLCQGIADAEAERPSFLTAVAVSSVRPFMGEHRYIKFTEPELRGAEIWVRSSPGMTRQWLTRTLRCHAVREGASSTSAADPFVVGGSADVVVLETDVGFVIRIAGRDKGEGVEILRRAKLLVYGRATAGSE